MGEIERRHDEGAMVPGTHRRAILAGAVASILAATAGRAKPAMAALTRRGDRLFLAASVNGLCVEALLDSAAETIRQRMARSFDLIR